ncbi:MAG: hypothetical protein AVDCRST_MAG22-2551 [uncultured Rubrobacteraceae bacterium]|uniref:Uncharacterized protein n=1 Tax=uncultured Rubrobacteraceae bacterium TaxID=349277 RepID=A0A6J4PQI6_9ACTN|nr:MAG: hypothetical protein AVDCRST_MAG22-2551 [uncultured Rubrobacteraceae bacterium]
MLATRGDPKPGRDEPPFRRRGGGDHAFGPLARPPSRPQEVVPRE